MPSYLGQTGAVEDMIHGVNYASAGAGIIVSSGSELVCFSFVLKKKKNPLQINKQKQLVIEIQNSN